MKTDSKTFVLKNRAVSADMDASSGDYRPNPRYRCAPCSAHSSGRGDLSALLRCAALIKEEYTLAMSLEYMQMLKGIMKTITFLIGLRSVHNIKIGE